MVAVRADVDEVVVPGGVEVLRGSAVVAETGGGTSDDGGGGGGATLLMTDADALGVVCARVGRVTGPWCAGVGSPGSTWRCPDGARPAFASCGSATSASAEDGIACRVAAVVVISAPAAATARRVHACDRAVSCTGRRTRVS